MTQTFQIALGLSVTIFNKLCDKSNKTEEETLLYLRSCSVLSFLLKTLGENYDTNGNTDSS